MEFESNRRNRTIRSDYQYIPGATSFTIRQGAESFPPAIPTGRCARTPEAWTPLSMNLTGD